MKYWFLIIAMVYLISSHILLEHRVATGVEFEVLQITYQCEAVDGK